MRFKEEGNNKNNGKDEPTGIGQGELQHAEKKDDGEIHPQGRGEAQIPNPFEGVDQHERCQHEHAQHVEELTGEGERGVIERASDADDETRRAEDDSMTKRKSPRNFRRNHCQHSAEDISQRRNRIRPLADRAVVLWQFAETAALQASGGTPIRPNGSGQAHQYAECYGGDQQGDQNRKRAFHRA